MIRTWDEASRLADDGKTPEEQLSVFLEDIWNENQIRAEDQIPVFLGQVKQLGSGDYVVQPLKTIMSVDLTNPYNSTPLRAFLGKQSQYLSGQTVICTVRLGRRFSPGELLEVNNIMLFEIKGSIEDIHERIAKRIIDTSFAPDYSDKLLALIAAHKWPEEFTSFVAQRTEWEQNISRLEERRTKAESDAKAAESSASSARDEKKRIDDERVQVEQRIREANSDLERLTNQIQSFRHQYKLLFPEQYDQTYLSYARLRLDVEDPMRMILSRLEFTYDRKAVLSFLMALSTSQIIALCGEPGTGKTTFARQMATSLGAKFHLIEVQNNWTDRSDILGFYNPTNGSYQSTAFLDALIEDRDDEEENSANARLHVICLDEMNLARVEYYFATFLSLLQQKPEERTLSVLPWGAATSGADDSLLRYQHLYIPSNVRFVGTMNMDDTAQNLSPKVVDRCIFIEFSTATIAGENNEYSLENAYFPARCFSEIWTPSNIPEIDQELSRISADPERGESGFIAGPRLRKYAKCMWPLYHLLVPDGSVAAYIDLLLCSKVLPSISSVSQAFKIGAEFPLASKRLEDGQARGKRLHPYDTDSWSYWE